MITLRFTHWDETAAKERARPLPMTAFEVSNSLCSSCAEVLDSPLGAQVLLRSTFRSLTRSSISCPLCRTIRRGLLGAVDGATDVAALHPGCKLAELVNDSEQATQIWGLRQISDHSLTDSSSELEVIMTKDYLEINLTSAAKTGIHAQEVPWGLSTLSTYTESTDCPYAWAFTPRFWPRVGFWDDIRQGLSWRTNSITAYHRASISAFPLPNELCQVLDSVCHEEVSSTGSQGRLRLAQCWLQSCLDSHRDCKRWRQKAAPLPSRVLDVGPADGSQLPFLYETKGEPGAYVCLSHRWGGSNVLTTTTGTLRERKAGISLESLPKTFSDATRLVRFLGQRYLWIDSLCILQDQVGPGGDWEAEAKKMGQIYRNALFTIVAAASTSADSGCFQDVDVAPLSARLPCPLGTLSLQKSCEHHQSHSFNIFGNVAPRTTTDIQHHRFKPVSALDSRGWVLQEEVLSARSLIFAEDGVYWECLDLAASEEFPNGTGGTYTRSIHVNMDVDAYLPSRRGYAAEFKRLLLAQEDSGDPQVGSSSRSRGSQFPAVPDLRHTSDRMFVHLEHEMVNTWRDIAENYSSRELTHESDRIIAIRGLASVVEQVRRDEFHAGLWRSFLEQQLLWCVSPFSFRVEHACDCLGPDGTRWIPSVVPRRSLHSPPVAPSWSWARVNQRVTFPEASEIMEYFIRIVQVNTSEETTGVTGRLTVQGILRPVLAVNERVQREEAEIYVGKICDPSDPTRKSQTLKAVFDDEDETARIAMCLPVAGLYPPGDKSRLQCLILEPTEQCRLKNPQSALLEFRRLGLAIFEDNERPFLGLGLPLGRGGDTSERGWTRPPVVLDII